MDSAGSSKLPPDARIVAVVRQLLESVDHATTSRRSIHEQAEEVLGLPTKALNARKALINSEIDAFQEQDREDNEDAGTDVLDDKAHPSDAAPVRSSPDIADNPDIAANTSNSLSPAGAIKGLLRAVVPSMPTNSVPEAQMDRLGPRDASGPVDDDTKEPLLAPRIPQARRTYLLALEGYYAKYNALPVHHLWRNGAVSIEEITGLVEEDQHRAKDGHRTGSFFDINAKGAKHGKGQTLLLGLCYENRSVSAELLAGLASLGADMKARDDDNNGALHLLCSKEWATPKLISVLVKEGLDVNARGYNSWTPLLAMCRQNSGASAELLAALISHGADVNARDEDDNNALHLLCQNSAATPELISVLVEEYSLDINAIDCAGRTPLLGMCYEKIGLRAEVLNALVSHGADVHARDEDNDGALHMLCCNSAATPELISALVEEHGLDINAKGCAGRTPLLNMCYSNRSASTELLAALVSHGADVNAHSASNNNALHLLCQNTAVKPELVTVLVDKHGLDINAKGFHGQTPLLAMCNVNSSVSVTLLDALLSHGANVNARHEDNDTALHLLCRKKWVTPKLINAFARLIDVNVRGSYGRTPLLAMCRQNSGVSAELLDALISNGALVNAHDNDHDNALHSLCYNSAVTAKLISVLVEKHKVDINAKGCAGRTPLLELCYENSSVSAELFSALASRGADVKACDKYSDNVLHHVCCNCAATPELISMIIKKHGLGVNAKGFQGRTPLLAMCRQNSGISIKLMAALISHGANLNIRDAAMDSALDLLDYNEAATQTLRIYLARQLSRHGGACGDSDTGGTAGDHSESGALRPIDCPACKGKHRAHVPGCPRRKGNKSRVQVRSGSSGRIRNHLGSTPPKETLDKEWAQAQQYVGVIATLGGYKARFRMHGVSEYFGPYEDAETAARAYDKAVLALPEAQRKKRKLNFPPKDGGIGGSPLLPKPVTRGDKRTHEEADDRLQGDCLGAGADLHQAESLFSIEAQAKKRKHNFSATNGGACCSSPNVPSVAVCGSFVPPPVTAVASISMSVEQVIEWMRSNFTQPAIVAQHSKYAQKIRDNEFDGYAMCDMCSATDPAAEFAELIDNRSHAGRMQRLWKRQIGMHNASRMSVMTV